MIGSSVLQVVVWREAEGGGEEEVDLLEIFIYHIYEPLYSFSTPSVIPIISSTLLLSLRRFSLRLFILFLLLLFLPLFLLRSLLLLLLFRLLLFPLLFLLLPLLKKKKVI